MGPEGRAVGVIAETLFGGAKVASNRMLLELLDNPEIRAGFVDALREVIQESGLTFAERDFISRVNSRVVTKMLAPGQGETDGSR